jgi:hypothetical protein
MNGKVPCLIANAILYSGMWIHITGTTPPKTFHPPHTLKSGRRMFHVGAGGFRMFLSVFIRENGSLSSPKGA